LAARALLQTPLEAVPDSPAGVRGLAPLSKTSAPLSAFGAPSFSLCNPGPLTYCWNKTHQSFATAAAASISPTDDSC